jgi:MoxR-like ATPase
MRPPRLQATNPDPSTEPIQNCSPDPSAPTAALPGHWQSVLGRLVDQVSTVVIGKRDRIETCVACLVAGGHLLIEDLPGVGKTTLAQALAVSMGLEFKRVQFTADLMPADLTGLSLYERQRDAFVFHPGPVFSQVLLADEINRAGPRTQSALLEAMEEHQVSADGITHRLPQPFFVIATQNPAEQLGTHPLPESQLDRFLMSLSLGYPERDAEKALLAGEDRRQLLRQLTPVMGPAELGAARRAVEAVHAAPALIDYLLVLLEASRSGRWFRHGLSPRAGLALLRAARARALMCGRDHVSPEDVQTIAIPTLAHRLTPLQSAGGADLSAGLSVSTRALQALIESVALP